MKLQVAGPWTLAAVAAAAARRAGALRPGRDARPGRRRCTEGVRAHVADLRQRLPGAESRCSSSTSRRCRRCSPAQIRSLVGCHARSRAVAETTAEDALRAAGRGRRRRSRRALLRGRARPSTCSAGPASPGCRSTSLLAGDGLRRRARRGGRERHCCCSPALVPALPAADARAVRRPAATRRTGTAAVAAARVSPSERLAPSRSSSPRPAGWPGPSPAYAVPRLTRAREARPRPDRAGGASEPARRRPRRPTSRRSTGTPSWSRRSTGARFDYFVRDSPTAVRRRLRPADARARRSSRTRTPTCARPTRRPRRSAARSPPSSPRSTTSSG